MNCPVCKRDLAPTLSICFTCGAMVNDSVREELETKISPTSGSLRGNSAQLVEEPVEPVSIADVAAKPRETPVIPEAPKPLQMRFETADLPIKKTSPTLVDFQIKNPKLPDWRLQLQNSLRQRSTGGPTEPVNIRVPKRNAPTNGANALKAETTEEAANERHVNPRVANALRRIEDSRKTFLKDDSVPESARPATARKHPFNVVARSGDIGTPNGDARPALNPSPRPVLVSAFKFEKKGFDTNKLPPLPRTTDEVSGSDLEKAEAIGDITVESIESAHKAQQAAITADPVDRQIPAEPEADADEIEDLAPLSLRFNAGLFDLIAGGFLTGIVMAPVIVSGGNWLSVTGLLALGAAAAVVTFLYLSISLAFIGRTLGMTLFSLEMVDVEENAYPTLHQAAVNSAAFILSIAFAGLGFLPIFLNEERRGVADLLAGTIMVREY